MRAISLFVVATTAGTIDFDASSEKFLGAIETLKEEIEVRHTLVGETFSKAFAATKRPTMAKAYLQTLVLAAVYDAEPSSSNENITADVTELLNDYLAANSSDSRADGKLYFCERGKKGGTAAVWLWSRVDEATEKKVLKPLIEKKQEAERRALARAAAKAAKAGEESEDDES